MQRSYWDELLEHLDLLEEPKLHKKEETPDFTNHQVESDPVAQLTAQYLLKKDAAGGAEIDSYLFKSDEGKNPDRNIKTRIQLAMAGLAVRRNELWSLTDLGKKAFQSLGPKDSSLG